MQGGKYKPLTQGLRLKRSMDAALTLLETVGIGNSIPVLHRTDDGKGCTLDDNGRLRFPRALIEDTLTICARRFPLFARDPKYDLEPWGTNVHFGTAGAAVHVVEPETETYRDSLLMDLYDAARIVDKCEHIHFFQRPACCPRHGRAARS
jgi:trimethylamine--corrinoid protein Co-methyltransferase